MRIIRKFARNKSVFKDFIEVKESMLQKAFETDVQYLKTPKFIKDSRQLQDVNDVLRKHFGLLKDQFIYQIADIKYYPVIGWMDYVHQCDSWGFVGKDLTNQDIDRCFIATNFEEVDLENNDDKSLCRYEFLEILVRLGKIKYFDTGEIDTIAEATDKLIEEFILPNHGMMLSWHQYRVNRIWKLEVDDLLKENRIGIEKLYRLMV